MANLRLVKECAPREKDQYDLLLDQALHYSMTRPGLAHEYAKRAALVALGARDVVRFNAAIEVSHLVVG